MNAKFDAFLPAGFRHSILVFVSCIFAHAAHAAQSEVWTLTTADLLTRSVELKDISSSAVTVQASAADTTTIPLDQFVSLHRHLEPKPSGDLTLLLNGGDRYTGNPGPVVGETLTWISPTLGKLNVPLSRLSQISRGIAVAAVNLPKQDIATLQSGDTVAGVFADCKDDKISMQTDDGSTTIPLANLHTLIFAPTNATTAPANAPAFYLELIDGTRATCTTVLLRSNTLAVTLAGTPAMTVNLPLSAVVRIEQINGVITWLSSRMPTESLQRDYFGDASSWPPRFDTALDGRPLQFQKELFDHGISVHAYSKLSFAVDPAWTTFATQYAIESIDGRPASLADVDVRIFADGKLVHEKLHLRSGMLSPQIVIDLTGVKTLTLECEYGNNGDVQARLDWLQPALKRQVSSAQSSSTVPAGNGS